MFRIITFCFLLLSIAVISTDAYVRVHDAQLACPDWPACYGQFLISDNAGAVSEAQQHYPNAPLRIEQVCKLLLSRYALAGLMLFSVVLFFAALLHKQHRATALVTSLLLCILSGVQAALSMWSTTNQAMPVIQLGYVVNALCVFWLACWLFWRSRPDLRVNRDKSVSSLLLFLASASVLVHIVLGVWTEVNNALLACPDFPTCNGSWWPSANYPYALDLFQGLWSGYTGQMSYNGQVAAHWLYRISLLADFVLLSAIMFRATSSKQTKQIRRAGMWLSGLMLLEICWVILVSKLGAPAWAAVSQFITSALLMLPLLYIGVYRRYSLLDISELLQPGQVPEEALLDTPEQAEIPETKDEPEAEVYVESQPETLYLRLKSQLQKTRSGLGGVLASVPLGKKVIDEDILEQIETSLIMADVGIDASNGIINNLTEKVERSQLQDAQALHGALKEELLSVLKPSEATLQIPKQDTPFVIMVVGVNGVGKTTTIGKLAKRLQAQGHSVMLAAGDTFRAAAVEQLQTWGERNNIHVVAQHTGADSASVVFDGVQSAKAKNIDVLIADTAGRLHTKSNLMEELKKIKRIMAKIDVQAPHEVLLVLDAGTGQNALSQAQQFNETVALTGIAVTKLDGTAKGGVVFALAQKFGLPIRFIGVGEGIDDLQDFHAEQFVDALFETT